MRAIPEDQFRVTPSTVEQQRICLLGPRDSGPLFYFFLISILTQTFLPTFFTANADGVATAANYVEIFSLCSAASKL